MSDMPSIRQEENGLTLLTQRLCLLRIPLSIWGGARSRHFSCRQLSTVPPCRSNRWVSTAFCSSPAPDDVSLSPQLPCLGLASHPWTTEPHSACVSFTRSYGRWVQGSLQGCPALPTPPLPLTTLPLGSQHQDTGCSRMLSVHFTTVALQTLLEPITSYLLC